MDWLEDAILDGALGEDEMNAMSNTIAGMEKLSAKWTTQLEKKIREFGWRQNPNVPRQWLCPGGPECGHIATIHGSPSDVRAKRNAEGDVKRCPNWRGPRVYTALEVTEKESPRQFTRNRHGRR